MYQKNSLLVGPLSEASASILEFSSNMFATVLVQQSIERLEIAEMEYKSVCESDTEDTKTISQKKRNLDACMASVQIATNFLNLSDESYIQ